MDSIPQQQLWASSCVCVYTYVDILLERDAELRPRSELIDRIVKDAASIQSLMFPCARLAERDIE